MNRVLDLYGIHNFRDYGGYAARGGAQLKTGLLWRSGQHVDATSADLDAVSALSLATIIDLRGDSERANHPCARQQGFSARVLWVKGETAGSSEAAPHIEVSRNVRTATEAHAAMARLYVDMPYRPHLAAIIRLYFESLAEDGGPSLIHCLAGKDRTGLAVALLHALMGVHADDIMADYLLTNVAGNIDRRIAAGALTVRGSFGRDMDDEAVRTLMSVHPEFLDNAMASIRDRHGDVATYAETVLGVDAAQIDRIEGNLLA